MGHIQDRWYRPKRDPDTGKVLVDGNGKPVREKSSLYGKGDRYKVRYNDHSGREKSKTFPDRQKRQAEAFLNDVEADLRRGTYIAPDAGKITFEEYGRRWLRTHGIEESTREIVASRLKNHVFPHLSRRNLDAFNATVMREWLADLRDKGLEASTRQVVFIHVQTIFNAAIDDELIRKNPCNLSSVQKPQIPPRKVIPWTAERVYAVHEAMADRYKLTVLQGAGLGLRQGEAFGMAVDDIDFEAQTVQVVRQVKVVYGKACFGPPKRNKTREVPLPPSIGEAIREHMKRYPPVRVTLPWQKPDGHPVTATLIISSKDRTQAWRPVYNQWAWVPALTKAKIVREARKDGFHALRHFYASTLLDAGENINALAEYLGHADPGFTLKVYTHLMPSSKARTQRAIDGVFGRQQDGDADPEAPLAA